MTEDRWEMTDGRWEMCDRRKERKEREGNVFFKRNGFDEARRSCKVIKTNMGVINKIRWYIDGLAF
jgi:hypothetical protein